MPIVDKIISNQLDIFRLTAGERKKAIKLLKKMQAELNGKLAAGNLTDFGKLKTNQLLKETTEIIDNYYLRIQKGIDEIMPKLAQHTADVTVESFVLVDLGASLPTENVIKSLLSNVLIQGAPSKDWWAKQSEDTAFKFSAQVRQGLVQGETVEQIRKRIQPILDVSQRNAAALVHTSIQTVSNDARLATFKANADILKGVKQLSTLDSHTSDICMAYSGASWDLDGNPISGTTLPFDGGPPRHINCRSVLMPITKSFRELGIDQDDVQKGERASDEGPIRSDITFDEYLKSKSKEELDSRLGKGRAELFREGKITLKDLIDQKGRSLTIDELIALKR